MGQVKVPGGGGSAKHYSLADCQVNWGEITLPEGITWGKIDTMFVRGNNNSGYQGNGLKETGKTLFSVAWGQGAQGAEYAEDARKIVFDLSGLTYVSYIYIQLKE